MTESQIESLLIEKLTDLKYTYRPDLRGRAALERNFREHFEALNRVRLTDDEFDRLLERIVTPDVFVAARIVRERHTFERDDGTSLQYTLVNIKDWCKNTFEVTHQTRMSTDYSHHRYDVILLINGVPVVHIELKALQISPRKAMQQIVEYKNDPGNGYGKTLLCFIQLFIVSNRTDTWYFANNNRDHFSFDADERFLPIYQYADRSNTKITHLDSAYTITHAIEDRNVLRFHVDYFKPDKTAPCGVDGSLKAKNGLGDDYFVYVLSQLIDLNEYYGGAVPSVNKTTLEGIEVFIPKPSEQQKIADGLSSVDDLITLEARKLDALKVHKKGLMQQLFPVSDEVSA